MTNCFEYVQLNSKLNLKNNLRESASENTEAAGILKP
jgi:hypothetical protein